MLNTKIQTLYLNTSDSKSHYAKFPPHFRFAETKTVHFAAGANPAISAFPDLLKQIHATRPGFPPR